MSDQRDRINAMLNLAQHPNTPQAEAESALAMASKLMQKHGLSQSDIASSRPEEDGAVVVERIHVGGLYRVRRQNILYTIALLHSCAGYRADDEGDKCVIVLYGRAADIFAARTLFAAADAMGARLLPRGDRSPRRGLGDGSTRCSRWRPLQTVGLWTYVRLEVERAGYVWPNLRRSKMVRETRIWPRAMSNASQHAQRPQGVAAFREAGARDLRARAHKRASAQCLETSLLGG